MTCRFILAAFGSLVAVAGLLPSASIAAVELNRVDQIAIHPTESTELTFFGSDLRDKENRPVRLWTSFPADVEEIPEENPDRNRVKFRIRPKTTVFGVVSVRAYSKDSISKPLLLFADEQPLVPIPATSDEVVTTPSVLFGESRDVGEHVLAIRCKIDQPLVAEMVAARLGSQMDGMMILLDKDRREIQYADDHPITGADPLLRIEPTYDGIHYLVIRDAEYRGGQPFQIRLSTASPTATVFPSSIRIGETRQLTHRSFDFDIGPDVTESFVVTAGQHMGMSQVRVPGEAAASLHRVLQTELPVYAEGTEHVLPVPAMFAGQLSEAGQQDEITFAAQAGQRLTIAIHAAKLASRLIPVVRLTRPDGGLIAEHHSAKDPDGAIQTTISTSGIYRLQIQDVLGRGGAHCEYCVSIRADVAPLSLKLKEGKKKRDGRPHRRAVPEGNSVDLSLRLERRGYDGPVTIFARTSDGKILDVQNEMIKEKANEADVTIVLPAVEEITVLQLCVRAECEIDGRRYKRSLDMKEWIARDVPTDSWTPGYLENQLPVVVSPRKVAAPEPVADSEPAADKKE